MPYRSREDIIREILTFLADKPKKKTHVMTKGAGLSYSQLKHYEKILTDNGLMTINAEGEWVISKKGKDLLSVSGKYSEVLATKSK